MALSTCSVGIRIVGRLAIFDIVLHLATIGTAQTDDPSHFASLYKHHAVQNFGFRRERDVRRLQGRYEFIGRYFGLTQNTGESADFDFAMQGHNADYGTTAHDDVASGLASFLETKAL